MGYSRPARKYFTVAPHLSRDPEIVPLPPSSAREKDDEGARWIVTTLN